VGFRFATNASSVTACMSDDTDGIDRPRLPYKPWHIDSPGGCLAFLAFLFLCLIAWAIYDWFD
jgi:hypothetical protein